MPGPGLDERGFIATEVSLQKVSPTFSPLVSASAEGLVEEFGPLLKSVYLYGSVATGRAREGKSDLDILVISAAPVTPDLSLGISKIAAELSTKFKLRVREVGLALASSDELFSMAERYGLLCFVKHLCVCIHGEDLARNVPPYRPTVEVARGFNGDIAAELEKYRAELVRAPDPAAARVIRAMARKMVRTCFSLVMTRRND